MTNRPHRIAYVHPQFPESMVSFSVSDMLALTRAGHRVEVHSLRTARPRWKETLEKVGLADVEVSHTTPGTFFAALAFACSHPRIGLFMLRLIGRRCRGQRSHLWKALAALPRTFEIYQHLAKDPPDVIHAFWGHYPSLLIYMVKAYLPALPATLFLGAYDLRSKFPISADAGRLADAVFTHAEVNRAEIEALGVHAEKLHVIRRGLDLRAFGPSIEGKKREQHIVTVSRLTEIKRVDLLLRTFAIVKQDWPKATLTVVGDGPCRDALHSLAKELGLSDVTFTGALLRADVLPYIAEAPVFLFMSPKERLPNVLKEAMALGCICVTSYSDGLEELIPSAGYGFILGQNPEEKDPLLEGAKIIGDIFSGRIDTELIRTRGRAQIEEHFDVDKAMARYVKIWKSPGREGADRES